MVTVLIDSCTDIILVSRSVLENKWMEKKRNCIVQSLSIFVFDWSILQYLDCSYWPHLRRGSGSSLFCVCVGGGRGCPQYKDILIFFWTVVSLSCLSKRETMEKYHLLNSLLIMTGWIIKDAWFVGLHGNVHSTKIVWFSLFDNQL